MADTHTDIHMETSSLLLTTEPQRNSRHVSALTLRGAQRGITYSRVAILDNQSQFSGKKILEITKFRHLTRGDLLFILRDMRQGTEKLFKDVSSRSDLLHSDIF